VGVRSLSSEYLATLREIAKPVISLRKAPKDIVEATILRLCEEGLSDTRISGRSPGPQRGYSQGPLHQSHVGWWQNWRSWHSGTRFTSTPGCSPAGSGESSRSPPVWTIRDFL